MSWTKTPLASRVLSAVLPESVRRPATTQNASVTGELHPPEADGRGRQVQEFYVAAEDGGLDALGRVLADLLGLAGGGRGGHVEEGHDLGHGGISGLAPAGDLLLVTSVPAGRPWSENRYSSRPRRGGRC